MAVGHAGAILDLRGGEGRSSVLNIADFAIETILRALFRGHIRNQHRPLSNTNWHRSSQFARQEVGGSFVEPWWALAMREVACRPHAAGLLAGPHRVVPSIFLARKS